MTTVFYKLTLIKNKCLEIFLLFIHVPIANWWRLFFCIIVSDHSSSYPCCEIIFIYVYARKICTKYYIHLSIYLKYNIFHQLFVKQVVKQISTFFNVYIYIDMMLSNENFTPSETLQIHATYTFIYLCTYTHSYSRKGISEFLSLKTWRYARAIIIHASTCPLLKTKIRQVFDSRKPSSASYKLF